MHYYPQLDLRTLSFDEFAFWSENALWVHQQMMIVQQSNAVGAMFGGVKKSKS